MPKAAAPTGRFSIQPEANKFDDHFLDVVGNTFKFDHPKGLAEWLKNAADAYATRGVRDDEQYIVLRFKIGQPKSNSEFECIDFVGCSKADIDEALKVWGSPTAAKRGTDVATFGGHGNGGKFYMRQMFKQACMITYVNGVLNVFGFDAHHRYGFDKKNTNRAMLLSDALKFADIAALSIPKSVRGRWKKNPKKAGFSVVRGIHPLRFSGRATIQGILEGLRYHPQARRLLKHKQVVLVQHGANWGESLEAPSVEPRAGFETPREIPLPKQFKIGAQSVRTKTEAQPKPKMTLRTAEVPLSRSRELSSLNSIDILGEVGCIGSYRMHELGFLRHSAESEFIYGECECAFLEERGADCVSNDREKLISNDLTRAILEWVKEQVDALAFEIAESRRDEKKSRDLTQSSLFNQILDKWKNRFMARLSLELFGGTRIGDMFGGAGGGDAGGGAVIPDADSSGNGEGEGNGKADSPGALEGRGKGTSGGGGDEARRGSKFPKVLLSGIDRDPFDPDSSSPFQCDERHPPVYQRPVDIQGGVYWINTSRPLARKVLDRYDANHPRWREYLFQRYVEIILKQQVYSLQKNEADFSAEAVDNLIDAVTSRVHDAAAEDLERFLFDEDLTGAAAVEPSDSRL
jgi:hypothetical protein